MENAIGLFSRLGCRLRGFGDDARTREVIGRACRENGWFTPADICRAVAAVADGMLRRDALAEWLAPYPVPVAEPRRVLVVMAGNIPLVGFFDMLCVLAAGHRCLVKPSAKDTVLMEYVIGLLRGIDPQVPVEFYDGSTSPDAVIATGSDNANRYFRAQYAGIPALLRGNRQSVAVLGGRETPAQLTALADDIWAYSGLGCRSVSLLFLPEGYDLQAADAGGEREIQELLPPAESPPDDGRTAVPRPGSCRGRRRAGLSRGVEPDQLFVLQITRRGRGLARSTRCRTAMRRFGVHCLPPPRGFRPCTVPWADGLPRRQGCHRIPYDILFVN